LHAIGRRFESVHLHTALALILLGGFFCPPAPAVDPYPQTGPALDVYQRFVDHLVDCDFPALYSLLDEVSQAYLGCCLDVVKEIKTEVDANPGKISADDLSTLQMMFGAKDAAELFAVLMDRFFPPLPTEELARLRCVEINPLSPTVYRLRTANGREFMLVNQKGEWRLDLSDRFLAFYGELCDTSEQIGNLLSSPQNK
jgi:hypothetical protein